MVFVDSAKTPPKVNWFRWNLEQCEPNIGHWPWQILGAIRAVATVWEGSFFQKKRNNCSQNFQVLQLQAVVTLQWLQIAGNSLPSGPSTGCLVFIFTIRNNSKSFPWTLRSIQERYLRKFSATSDIRYYVLKPIVRCSAGVAQRAIYWTKADWIRNWK